MSLNPAVMPLAPGEEVGPYRVCEEIGDGGMGIVYRAERTDLALTVALKVIRPGLASQPLLARFEAERRALALMNHPGIARVYGAGRTHGGQPYVAMEYAPGPSITDHCDARKLSIEARTKLFSAVCAGVHHAHQKGIVHRDLKPSNIRVTEQGGLPVPKVIDFGIARATEAKSEQGAVSEPTWRVEVTPQYASPEQLREPGAVDVRSDVYSLGVVLYELLAGRRPSNAADPEPPSRELAAGGISEQVAAARDTTVANLAKQLHADLDWIALKAVAPDPEQRYATPLDLAEDLARSLDNLPVSARAPTRTYRLEKLVRRHRGAVMAGVLIALVLATGLVASARRYAAAQSSRQLAHERYEEVARLSDLTLIDRAREDAATLNPSLPQNIPAIERWLAELGQPLRDRLPLHQAALDSLRATALPYDEPQQGADRATHPQATRLSQARLAIDIFRERAADPTLSAGAQAAAQQQIDSLEAGAQRLEAQVAERRTWHFADVATQWRHDVLATLVQRLTVFLLPDSTIPNSLAEVERRLARAREVERLRTDSVTVAAWTRAIADIAASDVYGGLHIGPQVGLVPLGKDPQSGLWEFWHVPSGERPVADSSRMRGWAIKETSGLVLVLLPGGTFLMGAQSAHPSGPNYDPDAQADEGPVHPLTLDPFFISKYEMMSGQWVNLTGENPFFPGQKGPERIRGYAAAAMTWNEAEEVTRRLGLMQPTEAQWEYAARAGTTTRWWTGNDSASLRDRVSVGLRGWANIAQHEPNAFGLHDMTGGVWEFCSDVYGPYTWTSAEQPSAGADQGTGTRLVADVGLRCIRGGGREFPPLLARSANRSSAQATERTGSVGVRPARPLDPR